MSSREERKQSKIMDRGIKTRVVKRAAAFYSVAFSNMRNAGSDLGAEGG